MVAGRLLNLPQPQGTHVQNRDNNSYFAWCCDDGISYTHKVPHRSALELSAECWRRAHYLPGGAQVPLSKSPPLSTNDKPGSIPYSQLWDPPLRMRSSFPMACAGPCPWKPQSPWTLFFLPGSGVCGNQSHSRGANRVETELLSVFRVSAKDFLCSQKTILSLRPAPRTRGLCSPSPGRCLDPSRTSSRPLIPSLPLRAPCGPSLIPRAHTEPGTSWSLPPPLRSHRDNPPGTKTP